MTFIRHHFYGPGELILAGVLLFAGLVGGLYAVAGALVLVGLIAEIGALQGRIDEDDDDDELTRLVE